MTGLRGKRVLVVDDNSTNRNILENQLKQWRLEPVLAASGKVALHLLSENPAPDLVLTDMQMPEMDGADLARIIRQKYPAIPIILLSSIGHDGNKYSPGLFNSILTKPVKQHLLSEHIFNALKRRGAMTKQEQPVVVQQLPAGLSGKYPLQILVAEDNPVNQILILHILHKLGYDPDAVVNGEEVLKLLQQKSYDIILMDVQMPEIDGLEATRIIRHRLVKQPVIIALTANAMQGDQDECLQAGMDDYLSKPVRLDEVVAMLEKWGSQVTIPRP
jgi:CheY-like chemotaxis protein